MVNKVPPSRMRGSAKCAMRMKVQQEISIVVRKPSRETSTTRPSERFFRREGDGMNEEIQPTPLLGDPAEDHLDLSWHVHVQRHDNLRAQRLSKWVDVFPGLVVQVRDCEFRTESAERFG